MKFSERLVTVLNALTGGAVQKVFLEAAIQNIGDESDSYKYRKLSGGNRDLLPLQYVKAADMAFWLWQRNPLAQRIIQIITDFCVGEDFKVECKIMETQADGTEIEIDNEMAQKCFDEFCDDSINNFHEDFPLIAQELFLFGEVLLPTAVNETNGDVRIGFYDSKLISEVVPDETGKRVKAVKVKNGTREDVLSVVNTNLDSASEKFGKREGQALYFRINRVLSQTRGHSELIQSLDWIDGLDQFMFNSLEGNALRNAFFYDVEMAGFKQEDIDKLKVNPPKPGTVKVHNEKVKWTAITPSLQAAETAEATRLFKNFILAGKGYPEHWFADGGNTNLATAEQMSVPVMRMLKRKQNQIKSVAKEICLYVLDQKMIYNPSYMGLKENQRIEVQVHSFDFNRDDSAVVASAFVQTVTALVSAAQKGWVSDETAKRIVDGNVTRLGVKVDENETVEMIKEKNQTKEGEDIYDNLPDVNDFINKD